MKGIRDGWFAALEGHIGADGVGATGSPAAHLVKGRWIAEQAHIESSWAVEEWKSAELGRRENVRVRTRYRNRNGKGPATDLGEANGCCWLGGLHRLELAATVHRHKRFAGSSYSKREVGLERRTVLQTELHQTLGPMNS